MRPIVLSPRLRLAVESIGHCRCLADIGCDHGKVVVYCVQGGIADKAIAIDIAAPSLDKARRLAEHCGVAVDCRLGDGMAPLKDGEADCVLIAGIGGIEIGNILSAAVYAPPKVVLVPHRNAEKVRCLLASCGYTIVRDRIVHDADHWYPVIVAEATDSTHMTDSDWARIGKDACPWGEDTPFVGKDYADCEGYADYRCERIERLQYIIDRGSTDSAVRCELEQLKRTPQRGGK